METLLAILLGVATLWFVYYKLQGSHMNVSYDEDDNVIVED